MKVKNLNKVSAAGLLIALGIIYGDIGTSPLYVFKAIISKNVVSPELILGALSCIIWTLTLQTTVKYVWLTLNADNRGEGGIFSLYTLVRRRKKWLVIPAIIGGAALLADGMITPPISVTSAIEGLRQLPTFASITENTIVIIVLIIMGLLFFMQRFGSLSIGKLFGPIMFVWFAMLTIMGLIHLGEYPEVFKAFNPKYAFNLLITYDNGKGFWLLGAVFLCTTGAEALYSDLGHCGKNNIRASWIGVKTALIINYLGQGAYLLSNYNGTLFPTKTINPFFAIIPEWFLIGGIIIATAAAIIASQALISGSFTLISEAIRLNLWPRMKINYPTEARGQLFIPGINWMLFLGCCTMVLLFRNSESMEAAYGLAITLCMISTSILFSNYLVSKRKKPILVYIYLVVYLGIEISFLAANLDKFPHGGIVTVIIAGLLFSVMYVWFRSRKIKNRYVEFVKLDDYIPVLKELSNDKSVSKTATHLVFMTSANNPKEIEHKIIYSIFNRKPKRADIYWFVHVDTLDDPYTCEYSVEHIVEDDIIRVEFRLGFRIQPRVNLLFKKVVENLVSQKEVNITSRYDSLEKYNMMGDFQFIVMEKFLSNDNQLPFTEKIIMTIYFWLKHFSLSEEKGFGLDTSHVIVEKFPLIVAPLINVNLKRIYLSEAKINH